ncbi:unnamed protein product, partial [Prorocentrum cordatum]
PRGLAARHRGGGGRCAGRAHGGPVPRLRRDRRRCRGGAVPGGGRARARAGGLPRGARRAAADRPRLRQRARGQTAAGGPGRHARAAGPPAPDDRRDVRAE